MEKKEQFYGNLHDDLVTHIILHSKIIFINNFYYDI